MTVATSEKTPRAAALEIAVYVEDYLMDLYGQAELPEDDEIIVLKYLLQKVVAEADRLRRRVGADRPSTESRRNSPLARG